MPHKIFANPALIFWDSTFFQTQKLTRIFWDDHDAVSRSSESGIFFCPRTPSQVAARPDSQEAGAVARAGALLPDEASEVSERAAHLREGLTRSPEHLALQGAAEQELLGVAELHHALGLLEEEAGGGGLGVQVQLGHADTALENVNSEIEENIFTRQTTLNRNCLIGGKYFQSYSEHLKISRLPLFGGNKIVLY